MHENRSTPLAPILVIAFGSRVLGVNPATGTVIWQHEIEGAAAEISLIVTPDAVVAVGYAGVACFRYPTGEKLWSGDSPTQGRATVLRQGNRIFVGRSGEVECWSLTGKLVWHDRFKGLGVAPVSLATPDHAVQADHG